jgi:hypothetical protein
LRLLVPVAAGIVASLTLFVAGNTHAQVIGYSETRVIVKSSETFCPNERIQAKTLIIKDIAGNKINRIATGSQVSLQAMINNRCGVDNYPVMIILEVRDSKGITKYLAWQQIKVSPSKQTFAVAFSWMPDRPEDYEVRAFSFACTTCLGFEQVISHKISAY